MQTPNIAFVKAHPAAKLPSYQTLGSAGADLYAVEDFVLSPFSPWTSLARGTKVRTGLQLASMDASFELQIRARSSLASKGIIILNAPGTVDSDFREEILVLMASIWDEYRFKAGDRIAQMIVAPVVQPEFQFSNKVEVTTRNGGFGSTGA